MTDEYILEFCDSILRDAKAFSKALVDKTRLVNKETLERIERLKNGVL